MQETMHIEQVDPRILVPNPLREKARTVPDKEHGRYFMIRDSIVANGIKQPVIVQRDTKMILGGHTRCEIAIELEMAEVPVKYVDVDDDEALYMLLEDNLDHAQDERDIMKIAWQCKELKRLDGQRKQGRPSKTFHDEMFSSGSPSVKLNMSEITFWRYVSLNKLIPELQQIVSRGKIGVVAGNILSSLKSSAQKKVYESIKDVSYENSYNMTKTEAEGFKQAFGDKEDIGDKETSVENAQLTENGDEEGEEFYGTEADLSVGDESEESLLVEAAEFEEKRPDALQVLWERKGPDILGAAKDVENENGPVKDEGRSRLSATQKGAEEKIQSLLSINGDEARRAYSVTKVKSSIRAHQLAIERAEVDLISELATLETDSFEEIEEFLEKIAKSSERVTKKLLLVLEEIRTEG